MIQHDPLTDPQAITVGCVHCMRTMEVSFESHSVMHGDLWVSVGPVVPPRLTLEEEAKMREIQDNRMWQQFYEHCVPSTVYIPKIK